MLTGAWILPALALNGNGRRVLILIELQGANDGLNTVIPYSNDRYYSLRPNIGIEKNKVLDLDGEQGFHPSLAGLRHLYERGVVKIFQNVGYPNQIQSHFRSIEVWERGGDGNGNGRDGWFVNAVRNSALNNRYEAPGIYLGGTSDIFHGGIGYLGSASFADSGHQGRDSMVVRSNNAPSMLSRISRKRQDDFEKNEKISKKLKNAQRIAFGGSNLANQLGRICELLSADIRAPVFKVSIGGFDTHAGQNNTHRKLLKALDDAISKTVTTLDSLGVWDDVAIMTYSEFGRRAKENGARGTDHGTAAPHFLISKSLGSGIVGGFPDLERLKNGDLRFEVDYRAMYNYVLEKSFGLSANPFSEYRLPSV
ncbi:MAG: DUF1501 domain-containing protein [Litoricolaceae bacterium]|nr:DUF1501 domain-containing protein [Litorivicinaceae bacterium]